MVHVGELSNQRLEATQRVEDLGRQLVAALQDLSAMS